MPQVARLSSKLTLGGRDSFHCGILKILVQAL